MNNLKKKLVGFLAALMLITAMPGLVYATSTTVYYKNTPVNWDYGRKAGVISYSKVQSSVYEHSATANSTFSGWKLPGKVAKASEFVGTAKARAYWNCR